MRARWIGPSREESFSGSANSPDFASGIDVGMVERTCRKESFWGAASSPDFASGGGDVHRSRERAVAVHEGFSSLRSAHESVGIIQVV
jgi:hypothetical protein